MMSKAKNMDQLQIENVTCFFMESVGQAQHYVNVDVVLIRNPRYRLHIDAG